MTIAGMKQRIRNGETLAGFVATIDYNERTVHPQMRIAFPGCPFREIGV